MAARKRVEPEKQDKQEKQDVPVKRGRGRPKGTGGNKRPDRVMEVSPDDNARIINHNLTMFQWDKVDMNDVDAVKQRVVDYFRLCAEDETKPSVTGFALAFKVNRVTLYKWAHNLECRHMPPESRNILKNAYDILNANLEDYAQSGKVNPVIAIFLMKNHFGYRDQTEMVFSTDTETQERLSAAELQQKYLTDIQDVIPGECETKD